MSDEMPTPTEAAEAAARRDQEGDAPTVPAAATDNGVLDLDAISVERKVKLGGRTFIAHEASIEVNKEITRLLPASAAKGEDEDLTPDEQLENLEAIYPQLRLLLVDEQTKQPPEQDFVERHLTTRRLRLLMQSLNPKEDEAGNAA